MVDRVFLVQNGILRLCGTVYLLTVVLDAATANKRSVDLVTRSVSEGEKTHEVEHFDASLTLRVVIHATISRELIKSTDLK
jgi:hypothetical protein